MQQIFSAKRAQMNGIPRSINIILGLITLGVGAVGIFGESMGIAIPEGLPGVIFHALIAAAGFILLLDGFMGVGSMTQLMPKGINRVLGALLFIAGVVLVLQSIGIIPSFAAPQLVIYAVLGVGGFILLLDGLLGAKNM